MDNKINDKTPFFPGNSAINHIEVYTTDAGPRKPVDDTAEL